MNRLVVLVRFKSLFKRVKILDLLVFYNAENVNTSPVPFIR